MRMPPRHRGRIVWLLGLLGLLGPWGIEAPGAAALRWVDEVKLGVLAHDNALGGLGGRDPNFPVGM